MANDNVQGLETLEAWKKSKALAIKIYKEILPLLPAEEKWNLNQQIRRSVSSVPANLAEGRLAPAGSRPERGHGRFYYQENIRFCYIARGSLTETYSHITLAHELGYIPADKYKEVRALVEGLARIINGYIAYLKSSKMGASEPGANYFIREGSASYLIDDPEDSEPSENQ